jgi:hypothetical protein
MRIFSQTACVDWSGAVGERPSGLAVATMTSGQSPRLLRARDPWSRLEILDWLLSLAADHTDIIIGLDLSFGFPFADRNSYFPQWAQSPKNARELWSLVDELCAADPYLGASSFLRHHQASRHFRHGQGVTGDLFPGGLGRMRIVEAHLRDTAQMSSWSNFNLVGAGQVGKSSLTGMRVLNRVDGKIPIWPFDPVPEWGPMIVEIYTSIAARAAGIPKGRSKIRDRGGLAAALTNLDSPVPKRLARYDDHATDAILTAAWLQKSTRNPALWHPHPLKTTFRQTEGWTFGVI